MTLLHLETAKQTANQRLCGGKMLRLMSEGKPGFSERETVRQSCGNKLRLMSNGKLALLVAMSLHSLTGSSTSTSLKLSMLV